MQQRCTQLVDIVRWDAGRHADGDARGAIGQQIREIGRQHHRLLLAPIVVRPEIDRVLLDAVEQLGRNRRQPRLGVTVGGRIIAVDVAEIALAVDQRVANREVLRKAGKGIVDRLVAVRMEVAHRLADDLGALAISTLWI